MHLPHGAPVPLDLHHPAAGGALRCPIDEPDPLLVHHIRADPHARALDRLPELRQNIVDRRWPRLGALYRSVGAVFARLRDSDHVMRTPRKLGGTAKRTRQR